MNYQEFISSMRTELSDRITPGATLKIQTITKNNGTHYDGLIILQPGSNIAPTIYLTHTITAILKVFRWKISITIFW